ncbi:MAG: hypothetical protein CM15mP49_16550 [Actinomycetota bacterium]|nr:MAG: hypothetical protein CM15mP49_16550 [Actinomycetota bacterium]
MLWFTNVIGKLPVRLKSKFVYGILPDGIWENPFRFGGAGIEYSRLSLAAIAVIIGSGLAIYYKKSRMGLCTRAVEDPEKGATFSLVTL